MNRRSHKFEARRDEERQLMLPPISSPKCETPKMQNWEMETVISALQHLLSAFPAPAQAEPEEVLRRYIEAVRDIPVDDTLQAVENFLLGRVEGVSPAFAPSAPQLAVEARRIRDKRLGEQQRQRALDAQRNAIEFHKEGTPESRAQAARRILSKLCVGDEAVD